MSEDELQQEMAFLREVIASVEKNADRSAAFKAAIQRLAFMAGNVTTGEHAPAVTGLPNCSEKPEGSNGR
jgi:hypothetical protein